MRVLDSRLFVPPVRRVTDDRAMAERTHARAYPFTTTMVPPNAADAGTAFCEAPLSDAEFECKHGRLAGDRTPPCGCWPSEPGYKPQVLTVSGNHAPAKPSAPKPKPATPVASLPPFIAGLVAELDAELARLQTARDALVGDVCRRTVNSDRRR